MVHDEPDASHGGDHTAGLPFDRARSEYGQVLRLASDVLGTSASVLCLCEPGHPIIVLAPDAPAAWMRSGGEQLAQFLARYTRESICAPAEGDASALPLEPLQRLQVRSYSSAALRGVDERIHGALWVLSDQPREWTPRDRSLLNAIAEQATVELDLRLRIGELRAARAMDAIPLSDPLTGLPNRILFTERLEHAIARYGRQSEPPFAVLFLDLDQFKPINDSLGHQIGDELLIMVARRLQACLRPGDTVARLGGDEFSILLEDVSGIEDAIRVVERIRAEVSAPMNLGGFEVSVSASIGVVLSAPAYDRPEDLLRSADLAMYRAKAGGPGSYEVFDRSMHAQALARLQLERDLRQAIEREEFRLYYQPIFALETGQLSGFEALVRWEHPERGLIAPAEFLSVANETGLILHLGRWILREACQQLRVWQERFPRPVPLSMGVNLSVRQFLQPGLPADIARVLQETGILPHSLNLEIPERAITDRPETAAAILGGLREQTVSVHLDDFGTGYSSLGDLNRLPLDAVKISNDHVWQMEGQPGTSLIEAIIALGKAMNVHVIAEGIRTAEQLDRLRRLGCTHGQGHLFSPARDAADVESWLTGGRRSDWFSADEEP